MDTLKKAFLVLVMACAFVTFVMQFDASASPYKRQFVTKHVSKVYPDLRTVERFIDVATHRPNKIKRFMHRNNVIELSKGTRVIRVGSALIDGTDAVVYKVRIPSRGQYGYVFSRNLKKMKKNPKCTVVHKVKYKEKHKRKYKEKCKVKYVERYVERYVEECPPRYHDDDKVKFKATLATPVLVINLL